MELLQLKYFVIVAHHEHMTRAAEELRIAQPALSKTIGTLEKSLGVKLFDREGKYIKLNAHGRSFLKCAEQALTILNNGQRELKDLTGESTEAIRLTFTVASHIIPELLSAFRQQHPQITFRLQQNFHGFGQPDFDLHMTSLPHHFSVDLESVPLLTEEILLAVPLHHPLAGRRSIKLEEAAQEAFISLKRGTDLRGLTDHLCSLAGFVPNIMFESDNPSMVRGLIREGLGIAFFPSVTWGGSIGDSVALLSIEEPVCKRTIGMLWSTNRYLTHSTRLFKDFAVHYFKQPQ
jgi:LysR family transcriptional activator of glutamate synthase operon